MALRPIKLMRTVLPTTVVGADSNPTTSAAPAIARTAVSFITGSLANNAIENDSVTISKTFQLLMLTVSAYARVRLYSTAAARTADANRPVGVPVTPGSMSGLIADVSMTIALGVQTWMMSPAATGCNDDAAPSPTIYAAVTNLSGATTTITVTLTYLPLE